MLRRSINPSALPQSNPRLDQLEQTIALERAQSAKEQAELRLRIEQLERRADTADLLGYGVIEFWEQQAEINQRQEETNQSHAGAISWLKRRMCSFMIWRSEFPLAGEWPWIKRMLRQVEFLRGYQGISADRNRTAERHLDRTAG